MPMAAATKAVAIVFKVLDFILILSLVFDVSLKSRDASLIQKLVMCRHFRLSKFPAVLFKVSFVGVWIAVQKAQYSA